MSDQNNLNNEQLSAENTSTIFSDPAHFSDQSDKEKPKKNKLFLRVLSALLAVLILAGGTFAAFKFIPELTDEENEKTGITVLNIAENTVDKFNFKNGNGTVQLNSALTEKDGASAVNWSVHGIDTSLTSSSTISSFVGNALNLSALQKIVLKNIDYGFSSPLCEINISEKDKTTDIKIGKSAPADIGYYCQVSTDKQNVYIISGDTANEFINATKETFANAPGFASVKNDKNSSCFNDTTIIHFDYIKISGKKHNKPFKIVMQEDNAINSYFAFKMLEPTVRVCDSAAPQAVLDAFSAGFTATGAYAYGTDAKTLKKYGLDEPDYQVSLSINGEVYTLKFSVVDENFAAFIDGKTNLVQKVPLSSIAFATSDITAYYSTFVILENLSGLKQFVVESNKGTFTFDIEYTETPEGQDDQYKAFYNGKELDIKRFKEYYGSLISMAPISFEEGKKGDTYAKIIFKHSSSIQDTILSFKQCDTLRYQAEIDSVPTGQIASSALEKFIADTVKMANNEY